MIKQLMLYGSTVSSNCANDNIMKLFKLQKRAAWIILEANTRSNSVKLFKELAWLPFYDEVKLNKSILVFKRLQGSYPTYMYDLFKFNADVHTRTGRYNKLNLVCPRFKRETEGGRTFSVSATRLWNQLPITLKKEATTVASFRKAFHRHYIVSGDEVQHFSPNAI